jgi:cytochrome c oxidase subunit IV
MSGHDHHNPSTHVPHIMPLRMYFGVGFGLIVLTVLTVWTAKFMPELIYHHTKMRITPGISIAIALIIAFLKASLVCLFFMHLFYDSPLNRLTFVSGLFFLSLFFIFTLGDTMTRETKPFAGQTEYMPKEFKILTGKPPKPYWVPAWNGYTDKGVKIEKEGEAPAKSH